MDISTLHFWYCLEVDTFQYLVCQRSDEKSGNDAGDQKCRCIVDQTGRHGDQTGNQKLTDIVRDTSGNADSKNTESGFLFHKSHRPS